MTGRVIRFPIADPLETALVATTELDREQLEQLQEQVAALLEALPRPAVAPAAKAKLERSPYLVGLPEGPRGGGWIEWRTVRHGDKSYGPYRRSRRLADDVVADVIRVPSCGSSILAPSPVKSHHQDLVICEASSGRRQPGTHSTSPASSRRGATALITLSGV